MAGRVVPGKTDLATTDPQVAALAEGWDPTSVTRGSNKKLEWRCPKEGHTFIDSPKNRIKSKYNCPYCSGAKVLTGFNDLKTEFPEIAKEAWGWDPTTSAPKSPSKREWRCPKGHIYSAIIANRTRLNNGCSFCANKQCLPGFNDIATFSQQLASEADGWDPSQTCYGTNERRNWKCSLGHTWNTKVSARVHNKTGCPYCAGQKVWEGFNDLRTINPELAKEADGWNPAEFTCGAKASMSWICNRGHKYKAAIIERSKGKGCPYCANKRVLVGFNDLASQFPNIASEADGWDPQKFVFGSHKRMKWRCKLGHQFEGKVIYRTQRETGCPICSHHQLLTGFNDLQTKFPELAKEADGWDPSQVLTGSPQKKPWICAKGHKWTALINNRCVGAGCPTCAEHGFDPEKEAWFYLMQRPGEQQFGISNVIEKRLDFHKKYGWTLIECVGPNSGKKIQETESSLKKWLRTKIGVVKGTSENWLTKDLEIKSLAELKDISGIKTDIF